MLIINWMSDAREKNRSNLRVRHCKSGPGAGSGVPDGGGATGTKHLTSALVAALSHGSPLWWGNWDMEIIFFTAFFGNGNALQVLVLAL